MQHGRVGGRKAESGTLASDSGESEDKQACGRREDAASKRLYEFGG